MGFKKIDIRDVKENFVSLLSDEWALVTAGDSGKHNTMTVSWGGVGELWGRDAAFIFIRPQRYTLEFVDSRELFTVSFFPPEHKRALAYCGAHSGRDVDKDAETGLTPVPLGGSTAYAQAKIVLVCRKLAKFDMDPAGFIDKSVEENYPDADYHKIFVGEIVETYKAAAPSDN